MPTGAEAVLVVGRRIPRSRYRALLSGGRLSAPNVDPLSRSPYPTKLLEMETRLSDEAARIGGPPCCPVKDLARDLDPVPKV